MIGAIAALSLTFLTAAWHPEPGYEAATPGLGVTLHQDTHHLHAGAYRNSLGRLSVYAGAGREHCYSALCAGACLLAVTGYERERLAPGLLPYLAWQPSADFRVVTLIVPPVGDTAPAVALKIEWRLASHARPTWR